MAALPTALRSCSAACRPRRRRQRRRPRHRRSCPATANWAPAPPIAAGQSLGLPALRRLAAAERLGQPRRAIATPTRRSATPGRARAASSSWATRSPTRGRSRFRRCSPASRTSARHQRADDAADARALPAGRVALKPQVVVILAGTNDIAGNTGPTTQEMIDDNLMSMTEIAKANGIRVVLVVGAAGVRLPVAARASSRRRRSSRSTRGSSATPRRRAPCTSTTTRKMADARGGLSPEMAADGVHPTEAGYRIMAPLAEAAIQEALRRQ